MCKMFAAIAVGEQTSACMGKNRRKVDWSMMNMQILNNLHICRLDD